MKKTFLVLTVFSICMNAMAQAPMIENNAKPVKLQDIIDAHQKQDAADEDETGEGGNYHFDRWLWYWRQHTDENGYLVSPVKTQQEWSKYQKQSAAKSTAQSIANWVFQGPTSSAGGNNGLGRINAIEFDPVDSNTYWVCSAGGGLWKTTNDGGSWTCLTENLAVLGTSDIDVNPLNPNTLYLCTGDRDHSDTYSIGVMKSTDGGQSWKTAGISWNTSQYRLANCLVINQADTNSLTLAASDGIYKSYDGGTNWSNVQAGHFKQVLYHPTDTSILYATKYNDGNGDAEIFRSANGGANWTTVTSFTHTRRITVAVTPANVSVVKAIVVNDSNTMEGIYSSKDTGNTFAKIYGSGCNTDIIGVTNSMAKGCGSKQGWYDLPLAISPLDTAKVYGGGVSGFYSTDGGKTWNIMNQWKQTLTGIPVVHADKHMMAFNKLTPTKFYECNDGGVYKARNPSPAATWTDISNGMATTQFYRNAVADNTTFVLAGAQDNGTKRLQGGVWANVGGGDGMDCHIDYTDSTTYYTATQYGKLTRVTSSGSTSITPTPRDGAWVTPYMISPLDHNQLIAGYKNIYWSPNKGTNWYQVTTDSLDYSRSIYRLAMTPADPATIYATTEYSNRIYYTYNFDGSSVQAGNKLAFSSMNCPYNAYISDIKVDVNDAKHFWVTFDGYTNYKVAEYKSGTWKSWSSNIPNVPVLCLEIDTAAQVMYIGTDVGVFYRDFNATQWQPFNTNMPSVPVTDIGINYATKQIWVSTFGRGVWSSQKQVMDTTEGIKAAHVVNNESSAFIISPNPNNGSFTATTYSDQLKGGHVSVTISDNTGRVVWTQSNVFDETGKLYINTEGLAKGMYIIDMITEGKTIGKQRFIINR
jgi:hypothetical protein